MVVTPVTNLPEKTHVPSYKNNAYLFQEFLNLNVKYAKVEFDELEYVSVQSAYTNLRRSAISRGYPLYVTLINGEIYFVRTDMED